LKILNEPQKRELTVKRILLDSVLVEPVQTGNSEQGACCTIERTDRTGAILRWLVDHKVQSTCAYFRDKREDNFKAPIADLRISKEQIVGGSEIARIRTCNGVRHVLM
jgi:hypothetical protein